MTVTTITKDPEAATMTVTAEFDAPVERVWQLWADPRQLERWWGPPTYPATVVDHDLSAGGRVAYFMTGPEGEQHHGWWRVVAADPPRAPRGRGRLRRRRRQPRRHAGHPHDCHARGVGRRRHPRRDPLAVPVARGDGAR